MAKRRGHREGSITHRHDHPSCPPLVVVGHDEEGNEIKDRPEHACRGRWVAMVDLGYHDGKRKRKAIYAATRKEAAIKLQEALSAKRSGSLVVGQVTVKTWLNYWLDVVCAERGLKVNTMKSHRSKVDRYLIPHLGHHRVDRLEPEHIRAMYAAMRRDKLSEATLRQTHAILHRALKVAVREGKASRNVAELIDPPTTHKEKRAGLTVEQARKVLRLAGWGVPRVDILGVRWYLALYLGMRQGEVLALRWADVDLDEGWLFVRRSLVRNSDDTQGIPKGLVLDLPKSTSARRFLPLPTMVLSRLKVARAEWLAQPDWDTQLYDIPERRWVTADDLVFHNDGKPIDHRADWQAWSDLLTAAGVPHVSLHAARNTSASLLEAAGVSDRMVAEILGHSSVQITHNYQASELARRGEAFAALEAYIEGD